MADGSDMQLSLNWNLDTTANTLIQLSTNLLRAATSDNIQVLALEACTRFGTCLPMCQEIRTKMGKLGKRRHTSYVLEAVAITLGYAAGDAADCLACTDAGERFLALAAALLSYPSYYESAKILLQLLKEFSPKDQLVPTAQQLKDLFEVLDLKIGCSGFTDQLMGWHLIVMTPENGFLPNLGFDAHQAIDNENVPSERHQSISAPEDHEVPAGNALTGSTRVSGLAAKLNPQSLLGSVPKLPSYLCPPAGDLAKMIQAMAEMERVGEASFAIFRVPAQVAVWVLAFVTWVLGVPPSVKLINAERPSATRTPLPQSESNITVEIEHSKTATTTIHCYKKIGDLHDLLWSSRSVMSRSNDDISTWYGMVHPREYFRTRIQEIQIRYGLHHLVDAMLIMAADIGPRIRNSDQSLSKWTTKPLFEVGVLESMIHRLVIGDSSHKPRVKKGSDLLLLWKLKRNNISHAVSLFLELLFVSLIENLHSGDVEFFIDSRLRNITKAFPMICKDMLEIFLDEAGPLTPEFVVLNSYQIYQAGLLVTGSDQSSGLLRPLISSKRGQVTYCSFIEMMKLESACPLRFRVVPGWLQYEGGRFASAVSEEISMFADILDVAKVSEQEYSKDAVTACRFELLWFCSPQDNFLNLYLGCNVPSTKKSVTVSAELFKSAPDGLVMLEGCRPECASLDVYSPEIVYCKTVAALLSDSWPEIFRVLNCAGSQSTMLFVQAALTERNLNMEEPHGFPEDNCICIVRGESCLGCACAAAEEILLELFGGCDLGSTKAIILCE